MLENSDTYFDNEPRKERLRIYKRWTIEQLKEFVENTKGKLFSGVHISIPYESIKEKHIIFRSRNFDYYIELK